MQGGMMSDEMMCSGRCEYRMTFNMSWTPESHPIDFPMNPMGFVFPFWTVSHNLKCAPAPFPTQTSDHFKHACANNTLKSCDRRLSHGRRPVNRL